MKVLFLKHVINVGKPGEIKEVKAGFAVNMLIPKGLAVELTSEEEKKHFEKIKKEEKHRMGLIENRHSIVNIINGQRIDFTLKTGSNKKVYGSINEKDIIDAIKKKFNIDLSRKHIELPDGLLRKTGEHIVYIKLGKDSMAKVFINIIEE